MTWISAGGGEMTVEEWNTGWIGCFGAMLDGRCRRTAIARHGEDDSVLIIMNASEDEVDFKLPHTTAGPKWTLLLDTNFADGASATPFAFDSIYKVGGRSFLAFCCRGIDAVSLSGAPIQSEPNRLQDALCDDLNLNNRDRE